MVRISAVAFFAVFASAHAQCLSLVQTRVAKVSPSSREDPAWLTEALLALGDASSQVGGALDEFSNTNMNFTPQLADAVNHFSAGFLKPLNESVKEYAAIQYPGFEKVVEWTDGYMTESDEVLTEITGKISTNTLNVVDEMEKIKEKVNASADKVSSALADAQVHINEVLEAAAAAADDTSNVSFWSSQGDVAAAAGQAVVWDAGQQHRGGQSLLAARAAERRQSSHAASSAAKLDITVQRKGGGGPCDKAKQAIAQANKTTAAFAASFEPLNEMLTSLISKLLDDATSGMLKVNATVAEALTIQFVEKNEPLKSALMTELATLMATANINQTEQALLSGLGPKLQAAQDALSPLQDALDAALQNVTAVCAEMQK